MSIFDAYNEEFNSLCQEMTKSFSELKECPNSDPDKARGLIRQCDSLLSGTGDLIKQMELEIRSYDASKRAMLVEKVNEYKKLLMRFRSDFERAKEQAQRSSLIGDKSIQSRIKYLDVNEKVMRQDELIARAQRSAAETEEVGTEIISELARNREKIESSKDKVHDISGITDHASKMLRSMSKWWK
eukprot:CAMPEP_0119039074 /NCGR_PEP_ID=MMETSP1177-20130426/8383_1 /TAXON_ID=2985 /ORGANISM="Ochromonas sp, Strain CCMP1899" /LENGTH=185 /DNA_ID=CAMNT_0007002503 /DNA_START=153 /DNA_END=710 /DNA_ORIENTATION=-